MIYQVSSAAPSQAVNNIREKRAAVCAWLTRVTDRRISCSIRRAITFVTLATNSYSLESNNNNV